MNVDINFIAVLLAAVVFMGIGFLWYHPMVLGKPWMKEKGLSADDLKKAQKEMGKFYGVAFVAGLLTAYVLAHVMVMAENFFHYSMLSTGLTSAFWMWLGFVMPTQLGATIFGSKNWKLFGIDTGYQLVGLLAMGVVIALL